MKALVVKNPFAGYQRGDTITDPALVADILAGEQAPHVTPTEVDDAPAPAAPAAKKPK
ncbi:hypothetical protein R5W24_000483 [Gemmata sp. JC717]|uniref:hypothetical protein n=1 Tax=Gemmata algarum TaxID=2975278 RepID=UPI0021BADE9C|nr:hypothetical protein [Gemmata algarum]MDY3551407.1 hypothetical protein [Gemmata algarum]